MTRIVPIPPPEVRAAIRSTRHPARIVPCPWCLAAAHQPCRSKRGPLSGPPHPVRVSHWALSTATCPACNASPGVSCTPSGFHFGGAAPSHQQRIDEATRADAARQEAS